jgi:polyisoprenoid-binding protein YceI
MIQESLKANHLCSPIFSGASRMNRLLLSAATLLGLIAGTQAEETKIALTGSNTTIEFVGTKKDGKHTGGFKKITGSYAVDAADPTTGKISVIIDTESLYSDDEKLTGHLKAPDFFSVKKFPEAKFVSSKIVKDGAKYKVVGTLTLLGKAGEVEIPATITAAGLVGSTIIDRTKWGMTYGAGKIDDGVALTVKVDVK